MKADRIALALTPLLLTAACAAPRSTPGAARAQAPLSAAGSSEVAPPAASASDSALAEAFWLVAADDAAAAAGAVPADASASPPAEASGWRFTMAPYFWLFDIDGHVDTKSGDTVPVSAHLGDAVDLVRDHLKFGFLGHFEATDGTLTWFADGAYIHVGEETSYVAPGGLLSGDLSVDVRLAQAEFGAAVRAACFQAYAKRPATIDVLGGARWNSLETDVDLTLATRRHAANFGGTRSTDWVDPFVGARTRIPLSEDVDFTFRADIGGGFGDGSDRAWNVVTGLEWKLTPAMSATAGYRWYDVERGSGDRQSDLQFEGPGIGMILRF